MAPVPDCLFELDFFFIYSKMAYHIIFSERMWCYFLWIVHILGLPSWVFGISGTLWHHDTMQHYDILMHLHWGAPQWHPTVGWAGLLDWLWRMHACPNVSHGVVAGAHAWSKSFLRREADGSTLQSEGQDCPTGYGGNMLTPMTTLQGSLRGACTGMLMEHSTDRWAGVHARPNDFPVEKPFEWVGTLELTLW